MAWTDFLAGLGRQVVGRPPVGAREEAVPKGAVPKGAVPGVELPEVELYELRRRQAINQVELAGRLGVTQGAVSKLEHAEDVRISTLRQYLEALGARLELAAVFDADGRRVPIRLENPLARRRMHRPL